MHEDGAFAYQHKADVAGAKRGVRAKKKQCCQRRGIAQDRLGVLLRGRCKMSGSRGKVESTAELSANVAKMKRAVEILVL